jgi:hypothetical protein
MTSTKLHAYRVKAGSPSDCCDGVNLWRFISALGVGQIEVALQPAATEGMPMTLLRDRGVAVFLALLISAVGTIQINLEITEV